MSKIINKTEKEILKVLIKSKEEVTGYEITARIYPDANCKIIVDRKSFVYKTLQNLLNRGIVLKKNSYPTFYRISPAMAKSIRTEIIMYEVQCPNCKKLHWVEQFQKTKQCSCLNSSNKILRFWITKKRFTGNKKIIGDKEKQILNPPLKTK